MLKITKYSTLLSVAFYCGRMFAGSAAPTTQNTPTIKLDVYEASSRVYCSFKTSFKCNAYTIEGKIDDNSEYKNLFYCNDELCVDASQGVDISFDKGDYACKYYRIKVTQTNGEVVYSEPRSLPAQDIKELEIVNTVVSSNLYLKFNVPQEFLSYQYSIAGINGESIIEDASVNEDKLDMNELTPGFYMISFKSSQGVVYHYKFFKTQQV